MVLEHHIMEMFSCREDRATLLLWKLNAEFRKTQIIFIVNESLT